jgi:hypothetical protein
MNSAVAYGFDEELNEIEALSMKNDGCDTGEKEEAQKVESPKTDQSLALFITVHLNHSNSINAAV